MTDTMMSTVSTSSILPSTTTMIPTVSQSSTTSSSMTSSASTSSMMSSTSTSSMMSSTSTSSMMSSSTQSQTQSSSGPGAHLQVVANHVSHSLGGFAFAATCGVTAPAQGASYLKVTNNGTAPAKITNI